MGTTMDWVFWMTTACIIWLGVLFVALVILVLGYYLPNGGLFLLGFSLAAVAAFGFVIALLVSYGLQCEERERARKKAIAKAAAQEKAEAARRRAAIERAKAEAERERAEAERKKLAAIQEERERRERYGWYPFSVAGVTFANEDGSSRQKILSEIYDAQLAEDLDPDVTLERYEYEGKPAIHVLVNGRCVGNVPRMEVDDVSEIMDKALKRIEVEHFVPDDAPRKRIYRADVTLSYYR